LIPKLIKPIINAVEKIEVEICLSGCGQVAANKFQITITSKHLVNPEVPGTIEYSVGVKIDEATGECHRVTGRHNLDQIGATIGVSEAYFHEASARLHQGSKSDIRRKKL
jgi:hypothetical protein